MPKQPVSLHPSSSTPASGFFQKVVPLLESVFSTSLDVNHYHRSFRSNATGNRESAGPRIEGSIQADHSLRLAVCLTEVTPVSQLPAVVLWTHLSALSGVEILPPVALPDGRRELWFALQIQPAQLGYVQLSALRQTLQAVVDLAEKLVETAPAPLSPELTKVMELYKNVNFRFVRPATAIPGFVPDVLKCIQPVSINILAGNPVVVIAKNAIVLEYLVAAMAARCWLQGRHFGLLKVPVRSSQLTEELTKAPDIPVIYMDLMIRDLNADDLQVVYRAIDRSARPVVFLSTGQDHSFPRHFTVCRAPEAIPMESLIYHTLYQLAEDRGPHALDRLTKTAHRAIEPFGEEPELLPGFCRQVLYLDRHAPGNMRAGLSEYLFQHLE